MTSQSSSLFSLLFLLLLPRPSLLYSLSNCTVDFYDPNNIVCDHNQLITIPTDIPKSATYLSAFDNNIKTIKQKDLTGFSRIETLHLGHNVISYIEEAAFSELSALTELILSSNRLTILTDNMFKGLSNLLSLKLEWNHISIISKFAFGPLRKLQDLDLGSNKLAQISDIVNIVLHCPGLKTFDIYRNQLTSFKSNDLPFPLMNLTSLDLSSNPLRRFSIHSDVFPLLESLSLFQTGPEFEWNVFNKAFLKSLKTLNLCETAFTMETYQLIFQSVDSVEQLYFQSNSKLIERAMFDLMCAIPSLQKLDLFVNKNYFLNDTLLQSCTNLTELVLQSNSLTDISVSFLLTLTRLTLLNLESNELSHVPLAIRNMSTLRRLVFESNHIRKLQCSDFLNLLDLTELNLKSNQIYKLSSCVFQDLKNLKVLDVQNNFLSQLDGIFGINLPSLVSLNVNGNKLGWVEKGTFQKMSSLTDLSLDSVSFLEEGAFDGLVSLKTLMFPASYQTTVTFADVVQLEKLVLFFYKNSGMGQIKHYEPTSVNLASLQELIIIVDKQTCFYWTQYVPKALVNLQVMSMDKYCCNTPDTFYRTPHLLNLEMTKCDYFSPEAELFQPLTDLQVLNLTHSNLKSLDFFNEANLTKLERLNLGNNELKVINETVFETLPSLKYLDLSGNPFVCNCSNAGFIQWVIRNKQVYVVDAFQYRCSSPLSQEGHFLLNFNVQSCWESTAFLCFISSSALVLVTLLSSFIYHFLRWQLVYGFYLFLAFVYDSKKRRQGCAHIYDAFVSYNVHDEDWVYRELLPELEGQQGWRLCLHHRDFQPGKPIIENITDAIYSSRKTLCVISRHYLQSEWCSREIQMASFRLFDEQKDVLILLFLEEISSNQLSPSYRMRKLVKTRTYLSWTQARSHKGLFWEKVRRALETENEPADDANPLTANV